jgi:hypothetical protein
VQISLINCPAPKNGIAVLALRDSNAFRAIPIGWIVPALGLGKYSAKQFSPLKLKSALPD